jgi:hypothetical protein
LHFLVYLNNSPSAARPKTGSVTLPKFVGGALSKPRVSGCSASETHHRGKGLNCSTWRQAGTTEVVGAHGSASPSRLLGRAASHEASVPSGL